MEPTLNFPVVTLGSWSAWPIEQSIKNQLYDKVVEMGAAGKTDTVREITRVELGAQVHRRWIDTAAANEWMSFVEESHLSSHGFIEIHII